MKKSTREWVRKAEGDFVAVRKLARGEPAHDALCFHSQQCAEKYLKALLEELGLAVGRTHNLLALWSRLVPHHGSLRRFRRGLDFLTRFAATRVIPARPPPSVRRRLRYGGRAASARLAGRCWAYAPLVPAVAGPRDGWAVQSQETRRQRP